MGGSGDTTDANLTMFNTRNGASGCYVDGSTLHIPADNTSQYYFEAIPVAGNWVPNTGQNFGISFIEASVYNSGQLPSNYFPGIGSVPGQSGWSDGRSSNNGTIVQGAFTPISGFGEAFQVWIRGRDILINTSGNLTAGQTTTFTLPAGQETVACLSAFQLHTFAVNFGRQPFKHGPPAGTSPVDYQTQNLPDAPIPNGA